MSTELTLAISKLVAACLLNNFQNITNIPNTNQQSNNQQLNTGEGDAGEKKATFDKITNLNNYCRNFPL